MHPSAARSNRSALQSTVPITQTPAPILHPPQQQILYGPIANPMVTLQPCGSSLHPSCIYPGAQRNAGLPNPVPLQMQGKTNRWPSKNKLPRGQQQYCQQQQQHIQQQLSYSPKPLVLYDQAPNTVPTPLAPTTSFLVASSTFTHGSFPGDQYNNSGVTLIPQPYFKPPDVQAFCLLQDRQNTQQQQQEQPHGPYYNISATNTCSLQTNSTFQLPNIGPYASVATFTNNQISVPVQSTQIFPNPPVNLALGGPPREKSSPLPNLDVSTFKRTRGKLAAASGSHATQIVSENYGDWPSQTIVSSSNTLFDIKTTSNDVIQKAIENPLEKVSSPTKPQEEHYSDESSTSFDFTIEAEKMVSALCNTSSNDLAKEEIRGNQRNPTALFSGAGDTASNKNAWFTDLQVDYGTSTSIAVQTDGPCLDRSQYSELIRKAAYWGCTEAEMVLNNSSKTDPRSSWLRSLSSATKTAITKSSTCFPIFAGDRVFVGDLINALLRVSNGWLILDNYLNRQHYPSLSTKFDRELIRCFQMWEDSTHDLLNQIVRTFIKLEENNDAASSNEEKSTELPPTSFPGDVSLYTTCDLFDPSLSTNVAEDSGRKIEHETSSGAAKIASPKLVNERHAKLRSKWTVTENLSSTIDSTKSMTDVLARGSSTPSSRIDSSAQSLNAEFFHLRNKVLESNQAALSRPWTFKTRQQDIIENKNQSSRDTTEPIFKIQRPPVEGNCENTYPYKCLPRLESSLLNPSVNLGTSYAADTNFEHNFLVSSPYVIDYKNFKNHDQAYANKAPNVDLVYVGKSSMNQIELASVPKNKMTLLSQIEPGIPETPSHEMTANLSAWFASMRNSDGNCQTPVVNFVQSRTSENIVPRLASRQEIKNTMDFSRQLQQIDGNRQLQTLQNMQSIQSAPWNACNLINNRGQVHQVHEEYDSSEDVRVYMKPGSYNVPKKRHQKKCNRRLDNLPRNLSASNHRNHYANKEKTYCAPLVSSTPVLRNAASSVCSSLNNNAGATMKLPTTHDVPLSQENSPRILKREGSYGIHQDITWKAACASAEILLEALNVKEDAEATNLKQNKDEKEVERNENYETMLLLAEDQERTEQSFWKSLKHGNDNCGGASSYEASEDDSGSTCRLSPNMSINDISQSSEAKNGFNKTNVKTDSWLIRTLNNASIVSKQKRRKKNVDRHSSSESSNSSVIDEKQIVPVSSLTTISSATTIATTTTIENFQQTICSRENPCGTSNNDQIVMEETERVVGKATYSETVRRCAPSQKKESWKKNKLNVSGKSTICSNTIPFPGRRGQRNDPERSYNILHKSRKSSAKKSVQNCEANESQIDESKGRILKNEPTAKDNSKYANPTKQGKTKDNSGHYGEFVKPSDRGWSVWYSSKRKQSLNPLALSKLETIHRTVWQMEDARIFKCPTSMATIDDYYKVIKSPMFLETIEYKLKNRVYHKVEHAIRDFRRIVSNSKLYYKSDHDRLKIIETLSRKLEELFEQHFASWDFDNISGSPREDSSIPHRFKSTGQKSVTGRYGNTKKSPSSSMIGEAT